MALLFDNTTRSVIAEAIEVSIGEYPIMQIRTGPPDDLNESGTLLAELQLPSDWMAGGSGGAVSKAGTWRVEEAAADGTAGHFVIRAADIGNTIRMSGEITNLAGAGPLKLSSVAIVAGSPVEITAFTLTAGNAV